MTTQANHWFTEFDPRSAEQCRRLIETYQAHLLEELERTGEAAPGFPVAFYLKTLIVWSDDAIAGFCSVDLHRLSVELIYIDPSHRGQGLARFVLTSLGATCPEPMRAKGPLSPAGQALVDSIGIGVADPDEEQQIEAVASLKSMHRTMAAHCRHKVSNPGRPCLRCYRKALKKSAEVVVGTYVAACWALAAKTVTPAAGAQL